MAFLCGCFATPESSPAAPKTESLAKAAKALKPAPVTGAEVLEVQSKWAAAIANISKVHKQGGDYIKAAAEAAGELYAYGHSNVMFKPTKAAEYRFRPTAEEAMSYFVGGMAVKDGYKEDGGFAINGGKGWASCVYNNHQVQLKGGIGLAMGTYDFTCATTGSVSTVEYTFGYTRCSDHKVRIFLHHSSVPFAAAPAANPAGKFAAVTGAEVLEVQSKWAAAIANISKVHKQGGDYIKAAAEAAGELYAYGHSNVMFKPTKAAEYRFRPTAEEAMSYFVGGMAVKDGYKEDGGFAINGGKGWASCVYNNHQVQLKGGVGFAMGTYDFTCATTGSVSTVEYTFGYTRVHGVAAGSVVFPTVDKSLAFGVPGEDQSSFKAELFALKVLLQILLLARGPCLRSVHVLVDCESAMTSVTSYGCALPGLAEDVRSLREQLLVCGVAFVMHWVPSHRKRPARWQPWTCIAPEVQQDWNERADACASGKCCELHRLSLRGPWLVQCASAKAWELQAIRLSAAAAERLASA